MERRRWCRRTAWGGGITSGVGIVLFALLSDAGGACTANVIVLNDGVIGPHGYALSSIAFHAGIGLMVVGAALLVGASGLAVIGRTAQGAAISEDKVGVRARAVAVTGPEINGTGVTEAVATPAPPAPATSTEPEDRGTSALVSSAVEEQAPEEVVGLPPGWYGNPSNRNGSVQWWDGHRLVDRPPGAE